MKKTKALIIENEYDIDIVIKGFLADHPKLFSSVHKETSALNSDVSDLLPEVLKVNNIIIATTFMYKDQVIEYIQAFLQLPDKFKFNFYVHRCVRTFNEWGTDRYKWDRAAIELRGLIIKLMEAGHTVYDFAESWDKEETLTTELVYPSKTRAPYVYSKLDYDKDSDLFYTDREYHDLNEMKDDYKKGSA